MAPFFDITTDNRDDVVDRLARFVAGADSVAFEEGRYWYDEAHSAAVRFGRELGVPARNAAGILAAVSPNLDAEVNFAEVAAILDDTDRTHVTTKQRDKARRCLRHDPATVLHPYTGPKTWSFFWNIHAPTLREHVTIDGRYADVLANRMLPWKVKRGIDTGGRGSRYERFEFVTEDVASHLRRHGYPWMTAVQMQAIAWCEAKRIERGGLTTRGTVRKQGIFRKGQPYT